MEHLSETRPGADGRIARAPGRCWHTNGRHTEREPYLVCKTPVHSHDMQCRSFCPFKAGEHVHEKECWDLYEQEAIDRCACTGYDPRTDEEVARDVYCERRACVYCGHPESAHSSEGNRPCRAKLQGYPTGWTCGAKDCPGYVQVEEFRLHPHEYLGSRAGAWSPQLEDRAKRLRDERDARDAEVAGRLAATKGKEDAR